jgi:ATP-dependent Clp protease ATP-binding subunit ClpB
VSFRNTIIIMTSNLGTDLITEHLRNNGVAQASSPTSVTEGLRREIMDELKKAFRPEFLNRLDDVIIFKPLAETEVAKIVRLLVRDLAKRAAERDVALEVSDSAIAHIVEAGFDPAFGARPLRRFIERHVEMLLARALIKGEMASGAKVTVDWDGSWRIRKE